MPAARGRAEAAGWRTVAGLLAVPQLLHIRRRGHRLELVYEDVFAAGRCRRLLADAINAADHESAETGAVQELVNDVCDQLLAAAEATGARNRLAECVPDLYTARLAPGARLDQ